MLAWCALWLGEQGPLGHSLVHSGHAAHMGMSQWTLSAIFVAGWVVMTVAMMLPTSSPLILLFHRMVGDRPHAAWLVWLLIAGYLAVWTTFGLLVHLLTLAFQSLAAVLPWLAENARWGSAAILLGAGLYQFSSLSRLSPRWRAGSRLRSIRGRADAQYSNPFGPIPQPAGSNRAILLNSFARTAAGESGG